MEKEEKKKIKKTKKIKKVKDANKVTFGERVSLKFRQRWMTSRLITILLIAVIAMACICFNVWLENQDVLPSYDATENKIYTLSDESKEAIQKVDQDIKIWFYGFAENSTYFDLAKQYSEANPKITYDTLTQDTNYELVQEYQLEEGYEEIIFVSGESKILVDESDLYESDYTTGTTTDVAEQKFTNSILSLVEDNKAKVYFVTGHDEFIPTDSLTLLNTYLEGEAFETESINLANVTAVPDDCSVLAIVSGADIFETEANMIIDYVNKGGSLFIARDVTVSEDYTNLQKVLAEFGAHLDNGFILEQDSSRVVTTNSGTTIPVTFNPVTYNDNEITSSISTMLLYYAGRISTVSDDELTNLRVTKTNLLESSSSAIYLEQAVTSEAELESAMANAQAGTMEIADLFEKTVSTTTTDESGNVTTVDNTAKLVLVSSAMFMSDATATFLGNSSLCLVDIYSNKDFALNSLHYLAGSKLYVTARKDITSSSYVLTDDQRYIVYGITMAIPAVILIAGLGVTFYRRKRK